MPALARFRRRPSHMTLRPIELYAQGWSTRQMGAILTTGPTTVDLRVIIDGGRTDVILTGYGS